MEKPIVDIRAVNHTWAESDFLASHGQISTVVKTVHRLEVRREGETEWTPITVIENQGRPDD